MKSVVKEPDGASSASFFEHLQGAFFRRMDWGAGWTTFLITLGVYLHTLAPTVTLEDSGELAVAPDYLGVPHPPGYPIWTLTSWLFQWLFHWVKYFGRPDSTWSLLGKSFRLLLGQDLGANYPNPAFSVGMASAVAGALACGILALLISRSGADMLRGLKRTTEAIGFRTESLFCWAGGVAGGLLLAFSPVMWSQSVIVEVYALNAFFQMLTLLLLYRWMCRPQERSTLYWMFFVFGLGLTNHQTLLFSALGLVVALMMRNLKLFRDFAVVGIGLLAVLLFNVWAKSAGRMDLHWLAGPGSPAFWIHTGLFVALPLLGLFLPNGRAVCAALLLAELGVAFYLFMPVSSDQNPPINWGYPRTWEGFIHAITRGQYEKITLADWFSARFLQQVGAYLADLRSQFTLPVVIGGFLPFCVWSFRLGARRVNVFFVALGLLAAATALVAVEQFFGLAAATGRHPVEIAYRLLILGVIACAGVGVLLLLVNGLTAFADEVRAGDFVSALLGYAVLALLALGLLFVDVQLLRHVPGATPPAALLLLAAVLGPPAAGFGLWALRESPAVELRCDVTLESQKWLLASLVAFISLSIIFITFQNLGMDVQTLFIGRVQFIQSHAVYALWLGYGLLFALCHFAALWPRAGLKYPAFLAALLVPGVLLYQNAFDEEQVRILGGAEQNGHDFGWQFGQWQLQGAPAITNEISPEERAAYPTPDYPPPMTPNAIFYGGTDPGRFVPTYMIYSALVRPDVYLITQNALADNTYMNVMRDLYGDTIWIPAQNDSNAAFQRYVDDIRAGRIAAGADVDFKDGRVSVQGVAGVMQINGILARMIFDFNKARHDFYVEESYVIPWMYPHLEPHGLIMKINREPIQLTDDMVQNDRKFWDWYTRRLMGNPRFLRDVVARKTFSKLRGAIAGIYSYRRRFADAEYAFRQAIELYPLSPEANFRLASEVLLPQGRADDAIALIQDFLNADPRNDKGREFLNQLLGMRNADRRRVELEKNAAEQRLDLTQALELADIYRRMNRLPQFDQFVRGLIQDPNLPVPALMQLAQFCADSQRIETLAVVIEKMLERDPRQPLLRVDLAAARLALGRTEDALNELRAAVAQGGEEARARLRTDARFDALRGRPEFQRLIPAAAPAAPQFMLPGALDRLLK